MTRNQGVSSQHGSSRPVVVAALMAVLTLLVVLVGGAYLLPRAFAPLAELEPTAAGLAAKYPDQSFRVTLKASGEKKILVVSAVDSPWAEAPADEARHGWARDVAWTAYTSFEDVGSLEGIAVGFSAQAAAYRFSIPELLRPVAEPQPALQVLPEDTTDE